MWKLILIVIVVIIYNWQFNNPTIIETNITDTFPIKYRSSLSINKAPIQKIINKSKKYFEFDEYKITPLAEFQLVARVLSAKNYRFDREADLSPIDLALGWGPMSKEKIINQLTITQSNRWYFWRTKKLPMPKKAIESNSANMHFIPANNEVSKELKTIDSGDKVKLKGYLVRIDSNDGWWWISSMSRNDTGDGSCEVILLEDIKTI